MMLTFCIAFNINAQEAFNLEMSHQTIPEGQMINVDITAENFIDMVSIQFSINFDPTVIEFVESSIMDLDYVAVGSEDATGGNLRVSWFDIDGVGVDMEDGKDILRLEFLAIGEIGDYTDIEITNTPIEIQIYRGGGGIFDPIELELENGSVTIGEGTNEPSISASIDNLNCSGENTGAIDITLDGTGDFTYVWTGPDGFTAETEDIADLIGGDYILQVYDADGLVVLDTLFSITQPLNALAVEDISTFPADCIELTGLASIYVTGGTEPYTYNIGTGPINQNNLEDLPTGSYSVTITDTNDCETIESFFIEPGEGPEIDLGEDMSFCEGEETTLEAGTFEEYEWNNGSTNESISVNETGLYSLIVTAANNCTSIDSIYIEFLDDVRVEIENDSLSICPGDSIQLLLSGADEYEWLDDSGTLSALEISNPLAIPLQTTNYSVIASNECGIDTTLVEVEVFEITATAGADTCIGPGEQLRLNASGGEFYYWIGGDYPLSDYNIPDPFTTPEDSTSYSIMIVDENNCTTFDTVTVLVGTEPLRFIKHINMITPNGDGNNDILEFKNILKYGTNTLKVFNRWGDVLYDRVDYQFDEERFDGTYKGELLPAGTYYYVLSFRNEQHLKQTLTIVRD